MSEEKRSVFYKSLASQDLSTIHGRILTIEGRLYTKYVVTSIVLRAKVRISPLNRKKQWMQFELKNGYSWTLYQKRHKIH
jgi:hypothetical protein